MYRLFRNSRPLALLLSAIVSVAGAQPSENPDKYAYLIPATGAQALAWVKQESDATRAKLEASPTFKAVLADMQSVHASEQRLRCGIERRADGVAGERLSRRRI